MRKEELARRALGRDGTAEKAALALLAICRVISRISGEERQVLCAQRGINCCFFRRGIDKAASSNEAAGIYHTAGSRVTGKGRSKGRTGRIVLTAVQMDCSGVADNQDDSRWTVCEMKE